MIIKRLTTVNLSILYIRSELHLQPSFNFNFPSRNVIFINGFPYNTNDRDKLRNDCN